MGYTTDFSGRFLLNKALDDETYNFLIKLNETRRMARKLGPEYGVEGEFFVDGGGTQAREDSIIDYNQPPATQPGLWCQWRPTEDRLGIEHDGIEKFHHYREWLDYIAKSILSPKGYTLSGLVHYQGEYPDDYGYIDGTAPFKVIQSTEVEIQPAQETSKEITLAKPRKITW